MNEQADAAAARVRHNRELIAERLGWPGDALGACLELEQAFPRWAVFWDRVRGYRAYAIVCGQTHQRSAETPDQLRGHLAVADPELPDDGLAAYRPLSIPGQRCYGAAGHEDECEYRWPHGEHPVGEAPPRA